MGPNPAVKVKAADAPKKAVLMSGPPGIGKTSSAKIICATLGFDVMEVNASDARGKVSARSRLKARPFPGFDCLVCSRTRM